MDTADGPVRFRIRAGAAHSWSTLLLESEPGALFVYRMETGELELIEREIADHLIANRAFRPWLGPSEWTSLAALPVAGMITWAAQSVSPQTEQASGYPAE